VSERASEQEQNNTVLSHADIVYVRRIVLSLSVISSLNIKRVAMMFRTAETKEKSINLAKMKHESEHLKVNSRH
jgi:hypothetical protein